MIDELNAQIERFSGHGFRCPEFPKDLEARFEADTCDRRSLRLAFEGLIAIVLFDLFLIPDHLVSPAEFHLALWVRLGIMTPIALAINFRLWHKPDMLFREYSIAAFTFLTATVHLFLESNVSAVNSAYALAGVLAILAYANTAVRLRFYYALSASLASVAGAMVFLHNDRLLLPHQKLLGLALVLITVTVSLIANNSSNREERLNYLLGLRGDVLFNDLHRSNQRLADMAETDGLTGLSNRLGFERKFEALWREAIASRSPFSIIMADVDHFKRVNDTQGHLYGDKLLKRIAHLIPEALRHDRDFAARFGGEEFVVLLPGEPQSSAVNVAERMRSLVYLAGFPPIDGDGGSVRPETCQEARQGARQDHIDRRLAALGATISCGVATTFPRTMEERQQLLEAADRALYAAKAGGRNRVEATLAERPVSPPDPAAGQTGGVRSLPQPVIAA